MMKVILTQNVARLGNKGDVVEVSDGYARNFLIKNSLAKEASASALRELETYKNAQESKAQKMLEQKKKLAESLKKSGMKISAKANEKGHLFEKINAEKIAKKINELAKSKLFAADDITLKEEIKELGSFEFSLSLGDELVLLTLLIENSEK